MSSHIQSEVFDLGNEVQLEMVYIPAGAFLMGTDEDEIEKLCKKYHHNWFKCETPQHQVTLKPFYMAKYPITKAQFRVVMAKNPSISHHKSGQRPIGSVSWHMAQKFCQQLSQQLGRKFSLPSEAQWEYACRSGTSTPFSCGETLTDELANCKTNPDSSEKQGQNRQQTTPVGSFPPNAFGLYDMHGNVWEWCADTWHDNYQNAPTDGSAWVDNSSELCVLRGGSWYDFPQDCRSALRLNSLPVNDLNTFGFRVVSSV